MTAAGSERSAVRTVPEGPWLGLESYREADAGRFFGREKETEELLRMVRREVLTIVFGRSGIGKTSLLRAGVFGRLAADEYFPVYIRPTYGATAAPIADQVLEFIQRTLRERRIEQEVRPDSGATLWEYLHTTVFWSSTNRILTPVLFLDQFEEAFTLGEGVPQTAVFLRELAEIVENYVPESVTRRQEAAKAKTPSGYDRQPYKLVITLREDFVHRLDALRRSMPSIMQNRYLLSQLNGRQALDAVAKPGKGMVTAAVAEQIVRFAAAGSKSEAGSDAARELEELQVEPALLSVVCQELYARTVAANRQEITSVAVEAAGSDILDEFYERSFEGLPPAARIFVEDRLLTASGYRNTAPLEDATAAGLDAAVMSKLVDRRLIRVEQRLGIPHVELTHDLLAKVVQTNRKARQEREGRLAAERDRAEQARSLRRARWVMLLMSAMAVASLVFGGAAFYSWGKAKESAENARKAERRAQEAEYIAQCLRAIDFAENELKAAQQQGDQVAAASVRSQLADLRKRLQDVKAGTWSPVPSQPMNVAVPAAARPSGSPAAPDAHLDSVLANWDIAPEKFASGYKSLIGGLSAAETTAVSGLIKLINEDQAVTDLRWAAYILATIRHESGRSWRTDSDKNSQEVLLARYGPSQPLGKRLGNTEPEDAYRYRGRGFLFLVGKGNYARFGQLMEMDDELVRNPDRVLEPEIAYRVAAQGMVKGWFTGRKLSDFISGDAVDYVNARRAVSGLDQALDISQAAGKLEQVLAGSLQPANAAAR